MSATDSPEYNSAIVSAGLVFPLCESLERDLLSSNSIWLTNCLSRGWGTEARSDVASYLTMWMSFIQVDPEDTCYFCRLNVRWRALQDFCFNTNEVLSSFSDRTKVAWLVESLAADSVELESVDLRVYPARMVGRIRYLNRLCDAGIFDDQLEILKAFFKNRGRKATEYVLGLAGRSLEAQNRVPKWLPS